MAQHFPRSPSSSGSSRSHRWCPLPVTLRRQLATSFSRLHERHPERCVGTHNMIIGAPPFQVGQQVWGLLGRGPGTARQSCHAMTDRQIHPLDTSGIQSPREAHPLQGGREICLGPEAHHLRDPRQLTPPIAFFHLAVDQTRRHLPLAHVLPSTTRLASHWPKWAVSA